MKHDLYRFIWFGCISVCIPIVLIGGVQYQLSMRSAVNEATQIADSSLSLAKDRLERIFGGIELSSLQLSANPLINSTFFDGDPNEKILAHLEILKLLQVAKGSNDFIDDIILYNDASEDILNNEHGYVLKKMYKLRPVLDQLMQSEPLDQCLNIKQPLMTDTLACVRFLPPSSVHKARGLLVVKLRQDLIEKYLEGPAVYNAKQSMLVLDSSHHVLSAIGSHFQGASAILNEASVKSIIRSELSHGSFFMEDASGEQFFYSFRKTELGRIYISKIAKADIYEHISWIRWAIALTILLFINIGIALSIYTSLKAYRPIRQLVSLGEKLNKDADLALRSSGDISFIQDCWLYLNEQTQKLNAYMRRWEPTIKESYYRQLLELRPPDHGAPDLKELAAIAGGEPRVYAVLVAKLENMHRETRFQRDDGPILSFIVKNVIGEMMQKAGQPEGEVILDRSGLGTAVLTFPQDMAAEEIRERLARFAADLVGAFHNYLKLNVSIGVGGVYRSVTEVSVSYKDALEALQQRLFKDQRQVFFAEELESPRKHASFYYPFLIEEALIELLESRNIAEAETQLKEYIAAVKTSESPATISQCYVLLLSSITKSLIRKGYAGIFDHHFVQALQEKKTSLEIFDWFVQSIFPYYDKAEKNENTNQLVVKVCRYINEHVHEDISLIQCAELVHISPSHLSKLFRKETGMHFLDYVLDRKLKEAQYLLANTGLTVSEIAQKIGYSERSLIRIFQKYIHMTPSQFRLSHTSD
ncbi:helix-turn-helix domain-containing protein [Paenibacillus thalictri]|nr:helix-turn-helix domain-containing protein [Paenibacillus thalictri]